MLAVTTGILFRTKYREGDGFAGSLRSLYLGSLRAEPFKAEPVVVSFDGLALSISWCKVSLHCLTFTCTNMEYQIGH